VVVLIYVKWLFVAVQEGGLGASARRVSFLDPAAAERAAVTLLYIFIYIYPEPWTPKPKTENRKPKPGTRKPKPET